MKTLAQTHRALNFRKQRSTDPYRVSSFLTTVTLRRHCFKKQSWVVWFVLTYWVLRLERNVWKVPELVIVCGKGGSFESY